MNNPVAFEHAHVFPEGSEKKLGKAPAKGHIKMLNAANYVGDTIVIPKVYNFWGKRKPIPFYDMGNNEHGNCTKASAAELARYMERLEQKRTIIIPKQNIIDSYYAMTARLYGGGDTGAYELDQLNEWRRPDLTFRDSKGRPMTIDAYARINQTNIEEVKRALYLAGAKGIKVCFNLPWAWSSTLTWDIPDNQSLTGQWVPGSWGGHSMCAIAKWDETWLYMPHTWNMPMGRISWKAFAIYCDESYLVVDSINVWKKKMEKLKISAKQFNLKALVSDVNMVSSQKIAA